MRARLYSSKLLLIFLTSIFFTGCATLMQMDRQLGSGNYQKAEIVTAEYKSESQETSKSVYLVRECLTYARLKKYDKLFTCLDSLDKNIEHGDKIIGSGVFNTTYFLPSDISLMPSMLRAEAYLDTGNYDKADYYAKDVFDKSETIATGDKIANWDRRLRISSLGLRVMANAFAGKKDTARQLVNELEDQSVGFMGAYVVIKDKRLALSKAYMALQDYENVLKTVNGVSFINVFVDTATLGLLKTTVGGTYFGYYELPQKFAKAKALLETGDIVNAKKEYDSLIANPASISNGEINWALLYDRGRIAEIQKDKEEAVKFYKRSVEIIETQRSTINTEASKIGFVGDKQAVYSKLIFALIETGDTPGAFEYAERSKSRALVDMLASADNIKSRSTEVAQYITDINSTDILLASNDTELDKQNLATRSIKIKKELTETAPDTASLVTVGAKTAAEIAGLLRDNETLLEYYFSGSMGTAFVMTKNSLKAFAINTNGLEDLVSDYRKSAQNPSDEGYADISAKLYSILLSPVINDIKTGNLVIVPQGVLHYLPFSALCSGSCLVDRFNISLLPSASTAEFIKNRHSDSPSLFAVGNPDLGNPLYDLAFAEKETEQISELFDKKTVLIRQNASESSVKNAGAEYSYIHFATHGSFDAESPLSSGLYLAKDADNDGLLTVRELYGMTLNADLVTLSACETGLGKVRSGDDLIGLQRGFLYAGASSIISTLWKVDDAATAELMVDFYTNLKSMSKSEALRKAQESIKNKYPHPYYWAAFQLTGSPI